MPEPPLVVPGIVVAADSLAAVIVPAERLGALQLQVLDTAVVPG